MRTPSSSKAASWRSRLQGRDLDPRELTTAARSKKPFGAKRPSAEKAEGVGEIPEARVRGK